ncbi:MAG: hypothetical protein WBO43_13095 [Gemmatimonadota bacterium]
MTRRNPAWTILVAFVLALVMPMLVSTTAAKDKTILFLDCFAVQMDGGRTGSIEIGIERWSEPGELDTLKTVLVEQGTDKLLKAVQKLKPRAGFVRTPNSLGWDVHFARQTPLPGGGTRVVIVTDRPINGLEAMRGGRSMDYEFQLAEIHLDKDGGAKGEGTYVGAGKVTYNKEKNSIEIENYGTEPVRLNMVQVRK